MQAEKIADRIKSGEHSTWGLEMAQDEAITWYVENVRSRIEPYKGALPEVVLEVLATDYLKTKSFLTLYVSLVLLAGDMEGKLDNLHMNVGFTLGDSALNTLKGEYVADGHINEVTEDGFLFLKNDYFHNVASDQQKQWFVDHNHLTVTDKRDLLIPVQPIKRKVELSVHSGNGRKEIHIKHEARFINTNNPNEEDFVFGPSVYFKENREGLLYKDDEERQEWIKILQILREPKEVANSKTSNSSSRLHDDHLDM